MVEKKPDFEEFLETFRKHRELSTAVELLTAELHKIVVGQVVVIEQILAAILQLVIVRLLNESPETKIPKYL